MNAKPIVQAVLYALAELRYGPRARECELGVHARYGLMVVVPRG